MAFDNLENVLNKYAKAYTQKFKAKLKSDRTNASGRLVKSIVVKDFATGNHQIDFSIADIETGWYFIELSSLETKKLIKLVKD